MTPQWLILDIKWPLPCQGFASTSLSFYKCQTITVLIWYVLRTWVNSRCDTLVFTFTFYGGLNGCIMLLMDADMHPYSWRIVACIKVRCPSGWWPCAFSFLLATRWCWGSGLCLLLTGLKVSLHSVINSTGCGILASTICFQRCPGAEIGYSPLWILPSHLLFIIEVKKFWHILEPIQHHILLCILWCFSDEKSRAFKTSQLVEGKNDQEMEGNEYHNAMIMVIWASLSVMELGAVTISQGRHSFSLHFAMKEMKYIKLVLRTLRLASNRAAILTQAMWLSARFYPQWAGLGIVTEYRQGRVESQWFPKGVALGPSLRVFSSLFSICDLS